ncbi:predicted protein [Coccidioides posadasii str. Silveira]|uniref:Predicted protein n=1 Tax=Coccidioides posadasii (strain RMSCC 757 / Silveira) TaxID=443226 RepID=E9DDF1_COCPS|nr:predicted protein [Coccidioides posadasii str. Silveira]
MHGFRGLICRPWGHQGAKQGETITKGKSGSAASRWGINAVLEVAQTRLRAHGREAHLV